MAQNEDKNLPPEYAHLGVEVKSTQARVQQIDKQIENLPPSNQPKPMPTPKGVSRRPFFDREKAEEALNQQKVELQNSTLQRVEDAVKGADQKTARQVKDNLREELFPNPFRKASVQDKNAARDSLKDIEETQNLMDSYFSRNQPALAKNKPEPVKTTPKKEFTSLSTRFSHPLETPPIPVKEEKKLAMSSRFTQSLSYTTPAGGSGVGKRPEKSIEPEPDKT